MGLDCKPDKGHGATSIDVDPPPIGRAPATMLVAPCESVLLLPQEPINIHPKVMNNEAFVDIIERLIMSCFLYVVVACLLNMFVAMSTW